MTTTNPLRWLLAELPAYIEPAPLAELMARYEANKRAYDLDAKIRHAERIVTVYSRRGDTELVRRWQAKLEKLRGRTA
jgi:hypothetical protein